MPTHAEPDKTTVNVTPIPVSGSPVTTAPQKDRESIQAMGQWLWDSYNSALALRRPHAIVWTMVQSFLKGIHYFNIDGFGAWRPIPPKEDELRSIDPIMKPLFRHALGIFNSSKIGVTVRSLSTGSDPVYKAVRAGNILESWIEEARVVSFADQANQILLTEGMVGFYRYVDQHRRTARLRALPSSELFPVPYDAKYIDEASGIQHAIVVTKQWLELQDKIVERQLGHTNFMKMADEAGRHTASLGVDLPMMGALNTGTSFEGALVITTWMKDSELTPGGEYFVQIGEKIFRHAAGQDLRMIMPDGEVPMELVYFDQQPKDFWGGGLCEAVLPYQFSADRAKTDIERMSRDNRPLNFYDTNVVRPNDVQSGHASFIPFKSGSYETSKRQPIYHHPATRVGADVGAILELSHTGADKSVGFRSNLIFGQQEGRTESGPATTLLSQNSMASFISSTNRLNEAWKRTYPKILDLNKMVWPEEKVIRIGGEGEVGRELKIKREDVPWSREVIILPQPILPGGRQQLASVLFQLRSMPGQDGVQGSEITSREFRQSLYELNLLPPGFKLRNKAESRIQTRINMLIGDGQTPQIAPSNPENPNDRMVMEDHKLSVEMLKEVILDDSYLMYGPEVQKALATQLRFHNDRTFNTTQQPDTIDNNLEAAESIRIEHFLAAAEADFETNEGDFSLGV